jgi:hypothetical protein
MDSRIWFFLQVPPFDGWRHNLLPWRSVDAWCRSTVVFPFGFGALFVSLGRKRHERLEDCVCHNQSTGGSE